MRASRKRALFLGVLLCWCSVAAANLVNNGGFEKVVQGFPEGWARLWTRDAGQGQAVIDM